MVKAVVNGVVTYYPGRHYNEEVDNSVSTVKKFYTMGSTTVAVRTVSGTEDVLNWVLGDHYGAQRSTPGAQRRGQGSASVTANEDGSWNSELKYTAFGEVRASSGLTPTEYRYTGQMEHSYIKLYWYRSRWFDNESGHFIQPDSIIPGAGDAKAYDRYAYVKSNPIRHNDPSGHNRDFGMGDQYNEPGWWGIIKNGERVGRTRDETFSANVSYFIKDLAEQGIDVEITQSARNPQLAHQWSTAYNIFIGNISIDDLRLNPIDMDGNVWFSEEWDNGNDRVLERKVKVNAWEKGSQSCFVSFWEICFGNNLIYALEGYSTGDPRRTPNISNVPISNHVFGLAVDLSWKDVEDSVIGETAAKHDLFRPLLYFKESPENWHFEPIKTR